MNDSPDRHAITALHSEKVGSCLSKASTKSMCVLNFWQDFGSYFDPDAREFQRLV